MISYAQNFEDVILWRALQDVNQGRYVDVGAFHPEIDSVTKWFYDQGWSGINIEPVPSSFALLEASRPRDRNVRAAAGASSGVAEMVVFVDSPGLSSLTPVMPKSLATERQQIIRVDVWPLHLILQPYLGLPIHFMKIDAEGSEREILTGMDFTTFRPWIVIVEATVPLSSVRKSEAWQLLLTRAGYLNAYFDGLNEFYVAEEMHELANRLAIPPNIFDAFEIASVKRQQESWENREREHQQVHAKEEHEHQNRIDELLSQLLADQSTINALSNELTEVTDTLKRTRVRAELAEAQRGQAQQQRDSELRRAELAELRLNMVLSSRSWRLLAPARAFKQMLFPRQP